MDELLKVFYDWRYPAAVAFVGSVLGKLVYRKIPAPAAAREHFERMARAGLLSQMAERSGAGAVQNFANIVGQREAEDLIRIMRAQHRSCLVWTTIVAAAALLPMFAYLNVSSVPTWLYGGLGLFGVLYFAKQW